MNISDRNGNLKVSSVPLANFKCYLAWVDDDTVQVGAGAVAIGDTVYSRSAAFNITFANIDTGARAVGKDYFVWAVPGTGSQFNAVISLSASAPTGYSTYRLLGYFHNGRDYVGGGSDGAIFQYSVCSNDLIIAATPYIAHPDLAAGIPLPGMVKCGNFAIAIYATARADATGAAAGSSLVPRSHYGVVPWCNIQGFEANAVAAAAGCRLPTLHEWWMAAMFNPGSATLVARQNGNTNSGASSDDATQSGTSDPTQAGRTLVGTGPRTSNWGAPGAGVSWYSPVGCGDMVGNTWEWVAHLAAGLYDNASYGTAHDWGYGDSDKVYNVDSYAYHPQQGGWFQGLPAMAVCGGYWASGANAGVRAVLLNFSPGDSDTSFGFRLAR